MKPYDQDLMRARRTLLRAATAYAKALDVVTRRLANDVELTQLATAEADLEACAVAFAKLGSKP